MASLLARIVASFDAIKPVPNLTGLDGEFNQLEGASGVLNGGSTAFKLLVKTSDGTDPPVDCDQVGAGLLARWKQNGSSKATITNDGSLTANGLTGAAGVYTFGSIPVGPASDPSTANQLARKTYVDNTTTAWSANWFEADPSTTTVGAEDRALMFMPDGTSMVANRVRVMFQQGSHTSGGNLIFTFRRRGPSGLSDFATISLDNTNNTISNPYTVTFANVTFQSGDTITYFISTRSGTITERAVGISVIGTQKRQ